MDLAGFHRRLNSVEIRRCLRLDLLDLVGGDDSFRDEPTPPHLTWRGMRPNLFVKHRLGERRLVRLVVSVTAIADYVDQKILAELRAILDRQADDLDARLCIVGVDVNDRNLEALGEIAGVARRPRIDR